MSESGERSQGHQGQSPHQQMKLFVSHAHEDDTFCRVVVDGLRGAGANVWYDEHNLGSGQLMQVIQRELGRRPVVVVILSKAAFSSMWVRREVTWAFELMDRDPSRLLLPVTGGAIERTDFDPEQGWLFLHDFKRVEAPGMQPFPPQEAMRRLLHALALTPAGEAPSPAATAGPQPTESVEDLLTRGKALYAQQKYAEALLLFERATQLAPRSIDAWANVGWTLSSLGRDEEALAAHEQAIALDPTEPFVWLNKGTVLLALRRYEEALTAYEQGIALDPSDAAVAWAWNNKAITLFCLDRYAEALAAHERAIALDPTDADFWSDKGDLLLFLKRPADAVKAFERAIALDPTDADFWSDKGFALSHIRRPAEALAAYEQAIALDPTDASFWTGKGNALRDLKRYEEALAAYEQGIALDPSQAYEWGLKARVLRALGRTAEAEAAERRAKELSG